jgi:4-diphosphocytidyl-2-C-methyl-D-erythritol kinase
MARHVQLRSFAKINLDLRVLHKRSDGYHELRTVFQTISLADTIDLEYRPGRTQIDLKSNFNIPDNIVVKAADIVMKTTGKTGRIGFVLQKNIPLGGGLGGGSSNAASVLLALPILLRKPLPMEKLMEMATGLGSDVPFFLLGGTAVGLSRGTELYPLSDIRPRPALLLAPGIHVTTAEAYAKLGRQSIACSSSPVIDGFQAVVRRMADSSPGDEWGCVNDFETVVFRLHPQLKSIKGKLLKLGARPALMSGSGSSLFGIFPNRELRDRAVESLRKEFAQDQVYSVTMVSRSRYRALWRRQLIGSLESKVWPPQERYAK